MFGTADEKLNGPESSMNNSNSCNPDKNNCNLENG